MRVRIPHGQTTEEVLLPDDRVVDEAVGCHARDAAIGVLPSAGLVPPTLPL